MKWSSEKLLTVRRAIPLLLVFFWCLCIEHAASAQPPAATGGPQLPVPPTPPENSPPTLATLIQDVIKEALADDYVDDKRWGRTSSRWDGFKVRGLDISARKKKVNHGLWERYRVSLVKPDQTLEITVSQRPEASTEGETLYDLVISARVRITADFAHWVYGAKGLNGTSIADATLQIRIVLGVSPKTTFSLSQPIPTITLSPRVVDVDLWLPDLDLRRVGFVRGAPAEALGNGMRRVAEEVAQSKAKTLKSRLQKKLDSVDTALPR